MSDENKKDKPGENETKVNVEATADVETEEGKTHEVEVEATATVTDLRDKQKEKESEGDEKRCIECNTTLVDDRCINADCSIAQKQASKAADRPTAKATAPAPRAVSSRGYVD